MKKLNRNLFCAVFYGVFGSLGFLCLVNFVLMTGIDFRKEQYPYSYPFCIVSGILSLCICAGAFIANVKFLEGEDKKTKTILKETAVAIVTFITGFFAWCGLWSLAGSFIEFMGW